MTLSSYIYVVVASRQNVLRLFCVLALTPPVIPFLLNRTDLCKQSVHFGSVAQSCPTLCNPMDCSTPGLSVHHSLLELTQTHVHRVGDAIQSLHPLSSPFSPAFNICMQ